MEASNFTSIGNLTDGTDNNNIIIRRRRVQADLPMDPYTFFLVDISLRIGMSGAISLFGTVTNFINAIVFYRQGITSDSSTLNLMGLTVSDFFCCLFTLWGSICLLIDKFYETPNYPWNVSHFFIFTAVRPKTMFAQITCWLTAYVAFERFVSVVFPFKVRQIFTVKRSGIIVCSIFIITLILYYPQYVSHTPEWVYYRRSRVHKLAYVSTGLISETARQVFVILNPLTLRITTIVIVIVCNVTILWKVKLSSKFRKSTAAAPVTTTAGDNTTGDVDPKKQEANSKEMKLLRMITLICTVFIICFIPDAFYASVVYVGNALDVHYYINSIMSSVVGLMETINSSVNIIIYYIMSTRFRQTLRQCIGMKN